MKGSEQYYNTKFIQSEFHLNRILILIQVEKFYLKKGI